MVLATLGSTFSDSERKALQPTSLVVNLAMGTDTKTTVSRFEMENSALAVGCSEHYTTQMILYCQIRHFVVPTTSDVQAMFWFSK